MYMSMCSHSGKRTGVPDESFKEVFGEHPGKEYYECVSPANIDLICANIFEFGDDYEIIDYEWTFDFPVPVAFIMWRMIHELYYRLPKLGALYTQDDMNHEFGIEPSDSEIFRMDNAFYL